MKTTILTEKQYDAWVLAVTDAKLDNIGQQYRSIREISEKEFGLEYRISGNLQIGYKVRITDEKKYIEFLLRYS